MDTGRGEIAVDLTPELKGQSEEAVNVGADNGGRMVSDFGC